MGYFLLKLNAPRPAFPFDITEAEKSAMAAHGGFWQGQADAGTALIVGPVFDPKGAWGMAVIKAENAAEAEALGKSDPVVLAGLGFSYDASPMPSVILSPKLSG